VALECWKVRRGDDGTLVAGRQGLLTHPLSSRSSLWWSFSREEDDGSAFEVGGVLLIHSSLAGLVTSRGQPLRIPSTFRYPGALYGGREGLELLRGGTLAGANALAVASGETEACG
jgi:hypothetical protein